MLRCGSHESLHAVLPRKESHQSASPAVMTSGQQAQQMGQSTMGRWGSLQFGLMSLRRARLHRGDYCLAIGGA